MFKFLKMLPVMISAWLLSSPVMASSTGMPWETPLAAMVDSVTGPVAFTIVALGVIAIFVTIIFGGDMAGWLRSLILMVAAGGVILFVIPLLASLFGVSSAVIASAGIALPVVV